MGWAFSVKCTHCGCTSNATVGAGVRAHKTTSLYPVYCKTCSSVTHKNEREKTANCDNCSGHDYISFGAATQMTDMQNRDHNALDGDHVCLTCKNFSLGFKLQMFFDLSGVSANGTN